MKFTRERTAEITIRAVSADSIRIGENEFTKPVAITGDEILGEGPDRLVSELTLDDLRPLLDTDPDIIVLGTGSESLFAPREVLFGLARLGVGLEVMTTSAAARTFNVLAGEARRVAALIYI